jgi:hypothetical protein
MWKLYGPTFQTHKRYVTYVPTVNLIFTTTSIFNITYYQLATLKLGCRFLTSWLVKMNKQYT